MAKAIRAPYFSYEDIRRKADEFLAEHHPRGAIPVPIEEIVEFRLGLESPHLWPSGSRFRAK